MISGPMAKAHSPADRKLFKIISILQICISDLLKGTQSQKNVPVSLSLSPLSIQYLAPLVPPSCQIPSPNSYS